MKEVEIDIDGKKEKVIELDFEEFGKPRVVKLEDGSTLRLINSVIRVFKRLEPGVDGNPFYITQGTENIILETQK